MSKLGKRLLGVATLGAAAGIGAICYMRKKNAEEIDDFDEDFEDDFDDILSKSETGEREYVSLNKTETEETSETSEETEAAEETTETEETTEAEVAEETEESEESEESEEADADEASLTEV